MELVTLQNSTASSSPKIEPKYKLFHLTSTATAENELSSTDLYATEEEKQMEFFYIGKNSRKINAIIQAFQRGFYAENVERAASIISRISEKDAAPEIIIVDGLLGEPALKE